MHHWVTNRWIADPVAAEAARQAYLAQYPTSTIDRHHGEWCWPHAPAPRTCSFCGSIHPEDALTLLAQGWDTEGTGKNYKKYLHAPGYMHRMRELINNRTSPITQNWTWDPTPPLKLYTYHMNQEQIDRANTIITGSK
jgi:hypothetical protein